MLYRLTTLAVPLIAFPRVVTLVFGTFLADVRKPDPLASAAARVGATDAANVAATSARVVRALNPLEKVLASFAGMVCLAMASMLVIQVRLVSAVSVRLSSATVVDSQPHVLVQTGAIPLTTKAVTPDAAVAPYRKPTLWLAVTFFAGLSYSTYSLALYPIAIPSAIVSAWGFWVVSHGDVSKPADGTQSADVSGVSRSSLPISGGSTKYPPRLPRSPSRTLPPRRRN